MKNLFAESRNSVPAPKPGPAHELQGEWRVISWQAAGEEIPAWDRYDTVLVQGNVYTGMHGTEPAGSLTLTVDVSSRPMQVDLLDSPGRPPFVGICERSGELLQLCWDCSRPGTRPGSFSPVSGYICLRLLTRKAYDTEVRKLSGQWSVVEMFEGERCLTAAERLKIVEFREESLVLVTADGRAMELAVAIDPATAPRSLLMAGGPGGQPYFFAGTYAFDGDLLKLAYQDFGLGPPSAHSRMVTLLVMQRLS